MEIRSLLTNSLFRKTLLSGSAILSAMVTACSAQDVPWELNPLSGRWEATLHMSEEVGDTSEAPLRLHFYMADTVFVGRFRVFLERSDTTRLHELRDECAWGSASFLARPEQDSIIIRRTGDVGDCGLELSGTVEGDSILGHWCQSTTSDSCRTRGSFALKRAP